MTTYAEWLVFWLVVGVGPGFMHPAACDLTFTPCWCKNILP
ncbi:hypothetical protein [Salmonella enterica]